MKSSVHSSVKDATSTVSPVIEIDPKEERALVWRLDIFFLTIGFLGYAFKYLDQTNISNAYVSGMETDLKLYGNELNYFTTFFNQWYLPHEMALRMSLYNIAQPVGAMLSGAMQGALSTNLDGALGRTGWRWAFIINPDRPNPLAKFYLRPRDIEVAEARTRRIGRDAQVGIKVKTFFRCFKFWHIWLFSIAWAIGSGITPSSYFNLWLKSLKNPDGTKRYSVGMLNYLPIAGQALQLVAELLFSGFSDYLGTRLPFLLLQSVISITSLIILIIRPGNEHAYMAGWYLNYVGAVSTMILCAWASAHLEKEPQVRTVLFATGTLFSYLFSAFLPIAAYPASEAPHWRIGAKLYLGLCSVAAVIYVTIFFMLKREARGKQRAPTQ
ncbi:hypothetical protein N7452_011166 [Penicillium brevicompactum]|uniref:Uncharacterized protein n=1 Tax=Penicillium brevicompactum TaxID=5074 RepID=A0A9W9U7A6_PENBR|nr:hypothetical protein N7452_011166 [Penicillium brevicompactum]